MSPSRHLHFLIPELCNRFGKAIGNLAFTGDGDLLQVKYAPLNAPTTTNSQPIGEPSSESPADSGRSVM